MIIEAGYDLFELFAPKIFVRRTAKRRQGTWVLAMDENLRNLYVEEVGGEASTPIDDRILDVVKALDAHSLGRVTYYALAQLDTGLVGEFDAEFEHLVETLRLAPELIDYEMLGVFLSDGKGVRGTGPRYSFRDYVGYEHLPRVAFLPGPHEVPCNCLACAQHEVRLQRSWERNHDSKQLDARENSRDTSS
ncbi:hypothetical protein [Homoserinimonas sp. A520]